MTGGVLALLHSQWKTIERARHKNTKNSLSDDGNFMISHRIIHSEPWPRILGQQSHVFSVAMYESHWSKKESAECWNDLVVCLVASSSSPHMWLADGDSLMCYLSGCRGWLLRCSNYFPYGDIGLFRGFNRNLEEYGNEQDPGYVCLFGQILSDKTCLILQTGRNKVGYLPKMAVMYNSPSQFVAIHIQRTLFVYTPYIILYFLYFQQYV